MNIYKEENDNGEVGPTIVWDALKAVMRGELISRTVYLKKMRLKWYQNKIGELRTLEQQHENSNDPELLNQIKEIRKTINEILENEVEMKLRFVKQTYYEHQNC